MRETPRGSSNCRYHRFPLAPSFIESGSRDISLPKFSLPLGLCIQHPCYWINTRGVGFQLIRGGCPRQTAHGKHGTLLHVEPSKPQSLPSLLLCVVLGVRLHRSGRCSISREPSSLLPLREIRCLEANAKFAI